VVLKLLPYQEEGYGWMVAQEANEAGPGPSSSSLGGAAGAGATTTNCVRGGILADEMGMGKTLQTICLLCHDKEQEAAAVAALPKGKGKVTAAAASSAGAGRSTSSHGAGSSSSGAGSSSVGGLPRAPLAGPTLVVAPSSAMWQWHDEVLRSVAPGALKVAMYYGAGRSQLDLTTCDVVITTYPVLVGGGGGGGGREGSEEFVGSFSCALLPLILALLVLVPVSRPLFLFPSRSVSQPLT
jgi:SNF2 family DNA or RNA helicase